MPIFKTAPASNFTQIDNSLVNNSMPSVAKNILIYLLSKPSSWQPKAHDIQKQLGLTAYSVRKALRWLCSAGYAAYVRLKSGHTVWKIFSKPKPKDEYGSPVAQPETAYSPAMTPQVENTQVAIQPVLIITETEEINKPLPAPAGIPESVNNVVVDSGLIYPVQLNPEQKKAAKHIIKKVKQPELQQPVLFALAYAITSGTVKSAPAYLQGLVKRANDGAFEPIQADSGTKADTRHIEATQERLKAYRQSLPSKPEKAKGFINQARAALRGAL